MKTFVVALASLGVFWSCSKSDPDLGKKLDELGKRVEALEASQKSVAEIEAFLAPIMAQQKAQQEAEEAQEPDPNALFAVPVAGNYYEGPADAAVTIIDAFDFA